MVLEYLPKMLGHFRAKCWVNIPAPWSIGACWDHLLNEWNMWSLMCWRSWGVHSCSTVVFLEFGDLFCRCCFGKKKTTGGVHFKIPATFVQLKHYSQTITRTATVILSHQPLVSQPKSIKNHCCKATQSSHSFHWLLCGYCEQRRERILDRGLLRYSSWFNGWWELWEIV